MSASEATTFADNPIKLVKPLRHGDARGWFSETYRSDTFEKLGIPSVFVQDNHSFSAEPFTLRGLHFQTPPCGQDKLVRCVRGRIFDVAVDVRSQSPTFGQWVGTELSADNGHQLFVPVGFAHGFLTLEPDCEVSYKCSAFYSSSHDAGLRWDDASLAIEWPIPENTVPTLSVKDQALPLLADVASPFRYNGRPIRPLD